MRCVLLLLFTVLLSSHLAAQNFCPPNIDFEDGNFNGWRCATGKTKDSSSINLINLQYSRPITDRHEIISDTLAKDFYGDFPVKCPYGGKYSVKLGNSNTQSQAEGISYTFKVPSFVDTFSFTYFYAVVFEDPGHDAWKQPRFFVTAYDSVSGALINCASYDYVASSSIPGFKNSTKSGSSGVLYKEWSPVTIQFAGLANRTVVLEFKTADCTLGAHFGYAYLDVGSACSNVLASAPYCAASNSVVLNAPYGFQSYTWYNSDYTQVLGTSQSVTLNPPPAANTLFYVDLVPYPGYGCRDTAYAFVTPLPVPDTPAGPPVVYYCKNDLAVPLTTTGTQGNEIWWYSAATGGIGSQTAPIPSTAVAGSFDYYVTQKVLFGCESLRKKITVVVAPSPSPSFTVNAPQQCLAGNAFTFTNTSTNLLNSTFQWAFGDGQTSTDTSVSHTFANYGTYTVKLKVFNPPGCSKEISLPVKVIGKPIAAFNFPSVVCQNTTSIVITDSSYVPGNSGSINSWMWNIGGTAVNVQNPAAFVSANAGPITIKLIVNAGPNCSSDTVTKVLPVRYEPVAAITFNKVYCENQWVNIKDSSFFIPSAAGEQIVKWIWTIDTIGSSQQNPMLTLSAGIHQATLQVQSSYGCKSKLANAGFVVNPRPHFSLAINDSCVFRNIRYQATDLAGDVGKWQWNFGQGLYDGPSLITKTYTQAGSEPLTLIARTKIGCEDTLIRPFAIYDNKAFAGRDTMAAMDEPVQLNAHGEPNMQYTWTPATGLSNPRIENPVATYSSDMTYRLDALSDKGCDSRTKIYIKRMAGPELYVPTGFTPNGDGRNDVLHVVPVGIRSFGYFAVYNRYGQRVFYTTDFTQGWNGKIGDASADAGAYVFVATAIDYKGRSMVNKGTVLLIK